MPVLAIITGVVLTIILSASVAEVGFKAVLGEGTQLLASSQPIIAHFQKCNDTAASADLKGLLKTSNNNSVMSNAVAKKGTVNVRSIPGNSSASNSSIQRELGCIINQSKVSAAELAKLKEEASQPHQNPPTVTLSPPLKTPPNNGNADATNRYGTNNLS